MNQSFEHIAFDLDDTLLDTYAQLVPRATRDACTAMIRVGLKADLTACLEACREREVQRPRHDLFTSLVAKFGVADGHDPLHVATAGNQAFYNREVESDIRLFAGADLMLDGLKRSGYGLHLVTAGNRATQEQKIDILGIRRYFAGVHHVDPTRGQRKREAFAAIMAATGAAAARHLSVGNRIDTDIAEAKELGWSTCWLRYGEYRYMHPTSPLERPDFTIASLTELVPTCRL